MSFTGENLFSRTEQVESTPKSLTKQRFARIAAGKSPSLSAKRSRKPRRVLYPFQVRRYLPRQEADSVKRWLLFLIGVILMQIFTENPEQDKLAPEDKYLPLLPISHPFPDLPLALSTPLFLLQARGATAVGFSSFSTQASGRPVQLEGVLFPLSGLVLKEGGEAQTDPLVGLLSFRFQKFHFSGLFLAIVELIQMSINERVLGFLFFTCL
uniref:Radiation-inducible immediate-early gene IEX-1 n=1 Tax=Chelonoidis abingdonii TaxID=106734 RepID=A0A8C0IM99_CHEAB